MPPKLNRSALKPKASYKGVWVAVGVVTAIFTALYPIAVYPYFHIKEYRECFSSFDQCLFLFSVTDILLYIGFAEDAQKSNRVGISREQVQPGNMRVWSDPFTPRDA